MNAHPPPPTLEIRTDADPPQIVLQGCWTAAMLAQTAYWKPLARQIRTVRHNAQVDAACWDLRPASQFDHVAAQVLWEAAWEQTLPANRQASAAQQAILERVARLAVPPEQKQPRQESWKRAFQHIGQLALGALSHWWQIVQLLGQLLLDVLRLLGKPLRGPWRDISAHLFRMGAQALPITALVGFLIGVVIAYLLALQLRQFGADAFIVDILGISLTRELGPLLAAILVAGRSGSAITAQIGVMRVNEELDAMRVMGIALGFRLVMPRALALSLAMPLVSVWTTLAALIGGMWASQMALDISPAFFLQALPDAVDIANLALGVGKSVVFGLAIALIGCHWGLWVKPNTQSLGAGTTASVVTSITAVIVIDAIFAVVFRNVGF